MLKYQTDAGLREYDLLPSSADPTNPYIVWSYRLLDKDGNEVSTSPPPWMTVVYQDPDPPKLKIESYNNDIIGVY